MEIKETPIKGLLVIQPAVFSDERGYFVETFSLQKLENAGYKLPVFIQDNESLSQKGVLRGLHLQAPPFEQGKLVRVVKGAVLDVAVDIRKHSPTYGKYFAVKLSGENKTQFWIPPGFAHGFLTLEDNTIFAYKCTNYYCKDAEMGLSWNDPQLSIDWNFENPILSAKDMQYPLFKDFVSPFE